jgi:hypothetical protein
LFGAELVAIDGSKFQAVASRKQVWNQARVDRVQAAIDQRIAEYLAQLDESDAEEPAASHDATQAALQALNQQRERLQAISAQLSQDTQYVASEPEARLVTLFHGYQVLQRYKTAADAKHSLIAGLRSATVTIISNSTAGETIRDTYTRWRSRWWPMPVTKTVRRPPRVKRRTSHRSCRRLRW